VTTTKWLARFGAVLVCLTAVLALRDVAGAPESQQASAYSGAHRSTLSAPVDRPIRSITAVHSVAQPLAVPPRPFRLTPPQRATTTTMIRTPVTVTWVETDFDRWADANTGKCPPAGSCENIHSMPTLGHLVREYFLPEDRNWALKVAFCESSGKPTNHWSDAVHENSGASGYFQHLPKFWEERSERAGFSGWHIMDSRGNVGVAAWLYYEDGGSRHWNSSKACWGSTET
jgi:hypothetical protein